MADGSYGDVGAPQSAGMMGDPNAPLLDDAMLKRLQELAAKFGSATKDDERQARGIGLLTAAMGTLSARGVNPMQALGQGGLLGIGAQQNTLRNAVADRGAGMNQALELIKMQGTLQDQARSAQLDQNIARYMGSPGGTQGAPLGGPNLAAMGSGGPTPANAQLAAARASDMTQAQKFRELANLFVRQPDKAKQLIEAANALDEKWSTTPQTRLGPDGQTQSYLVGERGSVKDLPAGYAPPVPLHYSSTADVVDIGRNPYTGTVKAPGLPQGISPADVQRIGIERQRLGIEQANQGVALGKAQTEAITNIRKEYNSLPDVQNYRAVVPLVNSAANAPNTRAGDLDMIYAVGKALDPTGVVREGEQIMIKKSGSYPQQFAGALSQVTGGGSLPPGQRQELLAMLANRVGQLKQAHDAAAVPYVKQAQIMNLPADQIFVKPPAVNVAAPNVRAQADAILGR